MTILFVYKSSIDSLRSIFNSCRSLYFIVFYISLSSILILFFFFFQAEDGIRDRIVTGVQTCALPIYRPGLAIVGSGHGRGPCLQAAAPASGIKAGARTMTGAQDAQPGSILAIAPTPASPRSRR